MRMSIHDVSVCYEISKEDYEKAMEKDPYVLIDEAIVIGYGVHGAKVKEVDGKYYLSYSRFNSCD